MFSPKRSPPTKFCSKSLFPKIEKCLFKKDFSKISTIIAFALITQVKKSNSTVFVIVDYFGVTELRPRDIIPTFDYVRFRGEGMGKFVMQKVGSWAYQMGAESVVALCTEKNYSANILYKSLGMQVIGKYHYRLLKI